MLPHDEKTNKLMKKMDHAISCPLQFNIDKKMPHFKVQGSTIFASVNENQLILTPK